MLLFLVSLCLPSNFRHRHRLDLPPEAELSAHRSQPPGKDKKWSAWHLPFLDLPGAQAQTLASPLPNREHDFSVTTPVADSAICPQEYIRTDNYGTATDTFTISNPFMYLESCGVNVNTVLLEGATFQFADGQVGTESSVFNSGTVRDWLLFGGSPETSGEISRIT